MKPSTLLQSPREEAYAFACVEHLRTACAREDLQTAEKSLEALRFIVCGFSGRNPQRRIWKTGKNCTGRLCRTRNICMKSPDCIRGSG